MFRVINFTLLIRTFAVITTILSILIYSLVIDHFPELAGGVRIFTLAPIIALVLTLLITSRPPARLIWALARQFNGSLYPDLNGEWEGEITTEAGDILSARAVIRQALIHTEIDLYTETTKSVTLEATPITEGGQYKLYYTYRAKPKRPGWGAYSGTTIFDIRRVTKTGKASLELTGYYYTERRTLGRTRLRQLSTKISKDMAFY